MPAPIAHFLIQTLRHRADLETRRLRSEWFDTSHPEVQQVRADFAAVLAEQGRIPAGRWAPMLKQVVEHVVSYLVQPVPSLVNFIFQGKEEALMYASITHRVAYFSVYPYLGEALLQYARENEEVNREQVTKILESADRERVRSLDADAWVDLLEPLFELFEAVDAERPAPPPELLATFFETKRQHSIADRLYEYQSDTISRTSLRRLLGRSQPVERHEKPPAPSPASSPVSPLSEQSGPLPRWMQFQHASASQAAPRHAAPPAPSEPVQSSLSADDDSRPLWMRFRPEPTSAAATPTPLSQLEDAVMGPRGPANRDFFIEQLFEGSQDAYERALGRIRNTTTWAEASKVIAQDVFRRHQVNIYSQPAALFTDLIETRFKQGA